MTALGVDVRARLHEVARAPDADVAHGGDAVHVMISGVNDGNGHAFTPETCLVQPVAMAHGNLRDGRAIDAVRVNSRLVDQ